MGLEQRGRFFVGPGTEVYEGMVVGRANDDKRRRDQRRTREETHQHARRRNRRERALPPPEELSLERAIEFIEDDELVEVTPKSIRIRKRMLDETDACATASARKPPPSARRRRP